MSVVINDFLQKCAARVASKSAGFTVVMGNEGGDVDSIVGAIYLAMLLDTTDQFCLQPAIPVVNFHLSELPLRNDVHKLFERLSIDPALLSSVTEDSSNFLNLTEAAPQVVLYDHNKLKTDQAQFSKLVVGVVDHHFDEKSYLDQTKNLRTVRTCGSACTLVAEMYRDAGVAVPCPELLVAPIVLDTVNFDETQKKVTPADVEMYRWLCAEGGLGDFDHTALFTQLSEWKNDILVLTVEQNLKRDYKFFAMPCEAFGKRMNCGIASVPCAYSEFVGKYTLPSVSQECKKFAEKHHLDAVVIAFADHTSGVHSRQMAFCAPEPCATILADYASSAPSDVCFSLIDRTDVAGDALFSSYSLSDPAVSRKRLVPSLTQFLSDGKRSSL